MEYIITSPNCEGIWVTKEEYNKLKRKLDVLSEEVFERPWKFSRLFISVEDWNKLAEERMMTQR